MSMRSWIESLFDSPSLRKDTDYSKDISPEVVTGVILVYRDIVFDGHQDYAKRDWMRNVERDMTHLHHDMLNFLNDLRHPFSNIVAYLESKDVGSDAFLDFLEVSLKSPDNAIGLFAEPNGNDIVETLNVVMDRYGCPYLLTPFGYQGRDDPDVNTLRVGRSILPEITAYPKAYLKQSDIIQEDVLQPALKLLSDPAFEAANTNFRKALGRDRLNDFDGVATSCVSALESAIKVASKTRGLKIRGDSLTKMAQSFLSKAKLPETFRKPIDFVAESRHKDGDAHGHATISKMSQRHARFLIALTAALVIYLVGQ